MARNSILFTILIIVSGTGLTARALPKHLASADGLVTGISDSETGSADVNAFGFCHGVQIASRFVLTSMHCLADLKTKTYRGPVFVIPTVESSLNRHRVEAFVVAPTTDLPSVNPILAKADFVLLKVPARPMTATVVIDRPLDREADCGFVTHRPTRAADGRIQWLTAYMPILFSSEDQWSTDFAFATTSEAAAHGDSGAPVVCRAGDGWRLVGLIQSITEPVEGRRTLAIQRLSAYADWIMSNTK